MLASIGSGSPSVPNPTITPRPAGSRPAPQVNSSNASPQKPSRPSPSVQAGVKRKAENGGERAEGQQKVVKTDLRLSKPPVNKPVNLQSAGVASPASTTPKRGYLAALEKAKAAQAAKPSASVFKHKPVERLAKKDRLALKAEAAGRKKTGAGQNAKPALGSKNARDGAKADTPAKEKSKQSDTGYKGTMRPSAAAPVYKGTMRPSPATNNVSKSRPHGLDKSRYEDRSRSSSVTAKGKVKGRMAGYASYSEVDLQDEEDEEDEDDGSDMSSDMEAGMDDMYEEEQQSLRAARKEDEEALREENELKARKEARKNAALAATRR